LIEIIKNELRTNFKMQIHKKDVETTF